ncbi:MAG: malto-oligosyltrehalose synthase [Sumerlaeia bacterium]
MMDVPAPSTADDEIITDTGSRSRPHQSPAGHPGAASRRRPVHLPTATYRVQFHAGFPFKAGLEIADYMARLGVSDLYASPIFQARRGSNHGYDVVDPNTINSELGGEDDFFVLSDKLRDLGLGWIQDFVPNHMAFDAQNSYLMDILENGPESPYYQFFDIEWDHPYESIRGKLLAPFLGSFYGDILENGEIKLNYNMGGLFVSYYDHRYPLKIESYPDVLSRKLPKLRQTLGSKHPDFVKFLGIIAFIRNLPEEQHTSERRALIAFIKAMLWELYSNDPTIRDAIDEAVESYNGKPGDRESFNDLDHLLDQQFFRLSYWRAGTEELNYRRFFTVNDLISLRMEDPKVFRSTHRLTLRLLKEGRFSGIRLDHIDGLYDPTSYLRRLRDAAPKSYIVVEKILEGHEDLPNEWPIQGTTGYGFLNAVAGVLVDDSKAEDFTRAYVAFTDFTRPYDELVLQKKRLIIGQHMAGDIDNLAHILKRVAGRFRYGNDLTLYSLRRSMVEILALFPVYRTYFNAHHLSGPDVVLFRSVIDRCKETLPERSKELDFIQRLVLREGEEQLSEDERKQIAHFTMKLQQFTGPLMAKGVEDTVFYIYNRLISLNEVGGDPSHFGMSAPAFHAFNQRRAETWPHEMTTTSTHDTKRGEDVRARISVLSEIPDDWQGYLDTFREINDALRDPSLTRDIPDSNDEYFLYQTILGCAPFGGRIDDTFVQRIREYAQKAVREAKIHTAWIKPDDEYEREYDRFVQAILRDGEDNEFLPEFRRLLAKVEHYGLFNSLSQVLLKLASPGVPDFYQGCEMWDLSLVDPDNRRPVNFQHRKDTLDFIEWRMKESPTGLAAELLDSRIDGRIKMFLTHRGLLARKASPSLFREGAYIPLEVKGRFAKSVVAFARRSGSEWAIAVAPRLLTRVVHTDQLPLGPEIWADTEVALPEGAPTLWTDALLGSERTLAGPTAEAGLLLEHLPVALLTAKSEP